MFGLISIIYNKSQHVWEEETTRGPGPGRSCSQAGEPSPPLNAAAAAAGFCRLLCDFFRKWLSRSTSWFQMGLFLELDPEQVMIEGNLDDPDLEAELAAITGNKAGAGGKAKPKRKS